MTARGTVLATMKESCGHREREWPAGRSGSGIHLPAPERDIPPGVAATEATAHNGRPAGRYAEKPPGNGRRFSGSQRISRKVQLRRIVFAWSTTFPDDRRPCKLRPSPSGGKT